MKFLLNGLVKRLIECSDTKTGIRFIKVYSAYKWSATDYVRCGQTEAVRPLTVRPGRSDGCSLYSQYEDRYHQRTES